MTMLSNTQFFVVIGLLALVSGHSYMTQPISRSNQAQTQTGCRGPSCLGPCDIPLSKATRAPISAKRGDTITVNWPRNNHAGGFIRFAWAPTALSDNHAAFDAHVSMITCHEIGNPTAGECAPADPVNDPNGGGSGPGDGSSGACNTVITVPSDLTDGKWTLQWAWFGGAFALGDYFSCTDYVISGGSLGVLTPVFKGGDFSYPNQPVCKYFNTDKLHVCTNEPCQNPIYAAGARVGPPAAGQLGVVNVPFASPSSPVTTGTQQTVTTGINVPSTTSRIIPSTTASSAPSSTTSKTVTVTSGSAPIMTTGSKAISPMTTGLVSSEAGNCAGASFLSTSTARITSIDNWASQFHASIEILVNEDVLSNWVLEVSFPTATQIVRSFNGGLLQCSDQDTAYYRPVASWANNIHRGNKITVEFIASNPSGMTSDYIMANTNLVILKN